MVEAPYGAHPTVSAPNYGWDFKAMKAYAAAAGEEGGWDAYRTGVIGDDEAGYLERVGGAAAIAALPMPIF